MTIGCLRYLVRFLTYSLGGTLLTSCVCNCSLELSALVSRKVLMSRKEKCAALRRPRAVHSCGPPLGSARLFSITPLSESSFQRNDFALRTAFSSPLFLSRFEDAIHDARILRRRRPSTLRSSLSSGPSLRPDPEAPRSCMPSGRLNSLESNFHISQHNIVAGEERSVLRDGQTCVLKRPGKKDVFFRVPVRKWPDDSKPVEYDVLEFPREV